MQRSCTGGFDGIVVHAGLIRVGKKQILPSLRVTIYVIARSLLLRSVRRSNLVLQIRIVFLPSRHAEKLSLQVRFDLPVTRFMAQISPFVRVGVVIVQFFFAVVI